jgi:hypothetical protein
MNTWREHILLAVVSTLTTAAVASGHIYRTRVEALARDELPAVVIKPGAEKMDNAVKGVVFRHFEFRVEVHARASGGNAADSIADPVCAAVHLALMADQTLGGSIARLVELKMAEPEFADGDDTAVMVSLIYEAIYVTRTGDNTQLLT